MKQIDYKYQQSNTFIIFLV